MKSLGAFYNNYNLINHGTVDFVKDYSDIFTLEMGRVLTKMKIPFKYGVSYDKYGSSMVGILINSFIFIFGNDVGISEDIFLDNRGINTCFSDFCDLFSNQQPLTVEYFKTEMAFDLFVSSICSKRLALEISQIENFREKAKEEIAHNFYEYFFHIATN